MSLIYRSKLKFLLFFKIYFILFWGLTFFIVIFKYYLRLKKSNYLFHQTVYYYYYSEVLWVFISFLFLYFLNDEFVLNKIEFE